MRVLCSDIEGDDLLDGITKVWCASFAEMEGYAGPVVKRWTDTDYADIGEVFGDPDTVLVMHNGLSYDKPAIEKVLGIKVQAEVIDTLFISWYLYPKLQRHGLAYWGEELGIAKPQIDNWEDLELEEYIHRCEEDVSIQAALWKQMWKHLMLLYGKEEDAIRAARHVSFKAKCAAMQQASKWKLDVEGCKELSMNFGEMIFEANEALRENMPKVPKYADRKYPKKRFNMAGELSAQGKKWQAICEEHGQDPDCQDTIRVITASLDPNPGSHIQLKSWLSSLGWKPTLFSYKRDKETNEVRKIPQLKDKDTGDLCANIVKLIEGQPALKHLEELSVVTHRKVVCDGFLKAVDDKGYVIAQVQGFTNTLRFKHKVCLNLPSLRKPYGKEIRGLLQARKGYELCGSDMASLEDRTKQHYMHPYDPDYVKQMQVPGFDPHLLMAVEAGLITQAESDLYKSETCPPEEHKRIGMIRHSGKSTNYAATYGAQGETIARAAGVDVRTGEKLCDAYWKVNWSLKAIADACIVKQSRGMKWLWNPVAKMWFFLKNEKDRFSTLNQSTGTYCFDRWLFHTLEKRPQLTAQFHDELIVEIKLGHREAMEKILKDAVAEVNAELKLNRDLDCDVEFGKDYSEIH